MLLIESPPLPGIVPALDVVKDIRSRLGSRLILSPIDPLPFEPAKETLGRGVVGATAHRTHTTGHAVVGQKPLSGLTGVLAAPIGVMQHGLGLLPPPDGHYERIRHKLHGHRRMHKTADCGHSLGWLEQRIDKRRHGRALC